MSILRSRLLTASAALLLAAGLPPAASAADGPLPLRGDLADVLEAAAPDELVPISIVLRAQADAGIVLAPAPDADKQTRRAAVIAELKHVANASAGELRAWLDAERLRGNAEGIRALWIHNVIAVRATPDVVRAAAARDDVAYVNYDRPVGEEILAGAGGNPEVECGVELMRAPEVWNDLGYTGSGVVVAVIDTGTCVTHPDLVNQIWSNPGEIPGNGVDDDANGYTDDTLGWNFRDQTNDPFDDNSHGTHVAGTVLGDGTNGQQTGMAPDAELMTCKIWNNFSGESIVWEAMQYGVDNGADIFSVSLGWIYSVDPDRATWRSVCESSIAAGVVVIYAAGNEGGNNPPDNLRTPGDVPDVITVGATDCVDDLAGFSSQGPVTWENIDPYFDFPWPPGKIKPTISGPGVDTLSTFSDCSGYTVKSGTSMATPHVAGAVALMLEANPGLDHFDVKTILMDTSIDLGPAGMDNQYGAGRVDAYEAVVAAIGGSPDPDLDGSGTVGFSDLTLLLGLWGPCPPPPCLGDLDGNGSVGFGDLTILLAAWGT